MPEIPPSLDRFSGFRQVGGGNDRFGLDGEGKLKVEGHKPGNVLSRAWDWLTRSHDKVESNKHTVREFIRGIRETHGEDVARMSMRELSSHLDLGRPLTGRRIEQVMARVEQMTTRIEAQNRQILDGCLDQLTDIAQQAQPGTDRGVLREAIRTTIEKDPAFRQTVFQTPVHDLLDSMGEQGEQLSSARFVEHFRGLALEVAQGMEAQPVGQQQPVIQQQPISLQDLDPKIAQEYRDKQIPLRQDLMPSKVLTDGDLTGPPKPLSGGGLSTPYLITLKDSEGNEHKYVFKEAIPTAGYGGSAYWLGIDPQNPGMPLRNIATARLDGLLGFNLAPKTELAMLNGKLGVLMEYVEGTPGTKEVYGPPGPDHSKYQVARDLEGRQDGLTRAQFEALAASNGLKVAWNEETGRGELHAVIRRVGDGAMDPAFEDNDVRRQLTMLQLLDALTGQVDRHGGNYLIAEPEGGPRRVFGIDNEQAFGTNFGRIQDLERGGGRPSFFVGLPPYIDAPMKDAIEKLSEQDVKRELEGLLPPAEIEKTLERLQDLKDYVAGLPKERLLETNQWGSERGSDIMIGQHHRNYYVGRDLA